MTPETLLASLRAKNVDFSVSEGKLRYRSPTGIVTPEVRDHLLELKPGLIALLIEEAEIDSREAAMRSQVPRVGPIPFLIAREAQMGRGYCLSCGELSGSAQLIRCAPCTLAAQRALAERPASNAG